MTLMQMNSFVLAASSSEAFTISMNHCIDQGLLHGKHLILKDLLDYSFPIEQIWVEAEHILG